MRPEGPIAGMSGVTRYQRHQATETMQDDISNIKLGLDMLQRRGIITYWDTAGAGQVEYTLAAGPAGRCVVSWSDAKRMLDDYEFIR